MEWPQLWIFKPQESYLGQGIRLLKVEEKDVENRDGIAAWAGRKFPDGKWTLQEYVRNPALYKDRKFDIRLWLVVTSMEPLIIHSVSYGFPKVSTVPYSPDVSSLNDLCMHIKMPLGEDCFARNLIRPYPQKTRGVSWHGSVNYRNGANGAAPLKLDWEAEVFPQMSDQVAITVLSALERVKHSTKEIFKDESEKNENRYSRFVLMSPDFAVDDTGKVFMEEMNTNGFMIGDTYESFFPAQDATVALMELLGADGYRGSWKYDNSTKIVLDAFFERAEVAAAVAADDNGEEAARKMLERVIREEMSSGGVWKRTFPDENWGAEFTSKFWNTYATLQGKTKERQGGIEEEHKKWAGKGKDWSAPSTLDRVLWDFLEWRRKIVSETAGIGGESEPLRKAVLDTCASSCGGGKGEMKSEKTPEMLEREKSLRPWLYL
jgi:hypothetical protein